MVAARAVRCVASRGAETATAGAAERAFPMTLINSAKKVTHRLGRARFQVRGMMSYGFLVLRMAMRQTGPKPW